MAEIVKLNGERVDGRVSPEDTAEAVLTKLLSDIKAGEVNPHRLFIVAEDDTLKSGHRYFCRSTCMTYADAIVLAEVGKRIEMDSLLGVEE